MRSFRQTSSNKNINLPFHKQSPINLSSRGKNEPKKKKTVFHHQFKLNSTRNRPNLMKRTQIYIWQPHVFEAYGFSTH